MRRRAMRSRESGVAEEERRGSEQVTTLDRRSIDAGVPGVWWENSVVTTASMAWVILAGEKWKCVQPLAFFLPGLGLGRRFALRCGSLSLRFVRC